jgi:hypothetical protein
MTLEEAKLRDERIKLEKEVEGLSSKISAYSRLNGQIQAILDLGDNSDAYRSSATELMAMNSAKITLAQNEIRVKRDRILEIQKTPHTHDWQPDGYDSHHDYYKCSICGAESKD